MKLDTSKFNYADSLKSKDTEEFIDLVFYRPIGYRWALIADRFKISPNQITVISIFIGITAGICFGFNELKINILGILLLILANSFDSADGQLARMTGRKTELGRILDGACGNFWFATIYIAIVYRMWNESGLWTLLLVAAAGYCHSRQAALADYFRNIHLHFMNGKSGSEWDDSTAVRQRYSALSWEKEPVRKFFERSYLNYTLGQEKATPKIQEMKRMIKERFGDAPLPYSIANKWITQSRPLLKYTNILSFNIRSFVLFIAVLIDIPWIYPVFELTVMNVLLMYMVRRYEKIDL